MDAIFRDSELDYLNTHQSVTHQVILELTSSEGRHGWPKIKVCHNNKIVYHGMVIEKKTVEFSVDKTQKRNLIKITLENKQHDDTVVDENNNITKDKFVVLDCMKIDRANVDPQKIGHSNGLWANETVRFYYTNPALDYISKLRPKGYFDQDEIQKKIKAHFAKTVELLNIHKGR